MTKFLDADIEKMMRADVIRAAMLPGKRKTFYLVEQPWTMLEEPWRIRWTDYKSKDLCEVTPVGVPVTGDRYCMFTTYSQDENVVRNYVFLNEQYHFSGEEDAPVDD